jgi:hypothetical protein
MLLGLQNYFFPTSIHNQNRVIIYQFYKKNVPKFRMLEYMYLLIESIFKLHITRRIYEESLCDYQLLKKLYQTELATVSRSRIEINFFFYSRPGHQ